MTVPLYNAQILRLAASIPHHQRLENPSASVRRTSPVCGSRVTVDVVLTDGVIADFGQEVRACALGQASASILGAYVIGKSAAQLQLAHDQLKDWLKSDENLPDNLADNFPELQLFDPARAHPARHASILLAFEAAAQAAREAETNKHE